jgi:hypothetical protein
LQCRPARKSRTGVGRQHFEPQPLSQHDEGAQQVGSQAGAAQAGAAAQPQAGSAAAQVASQQLGWQQPPPSMRSSRPAFASAVSANIAHKANKGRMTRDFMGRTPVPVGKSNGGLKLSISDVPASSSRFGLQHCEVSSGFRASFARPFEVRVLPDVALLSVVRPVTIACYIAARPPLNFAAQKVSNDD